MNKLFKYELSNRQIFAQVLSAHVGRVYFPTQAKIFSSCFFLRWKRWEPKVATTYLEVQSIKFRTSWPFENSWKSTADAIRMLWQFSGKSEVDRILSSSVPKHVHYPWSKVEKCFWIWYSLPSIIPKSLYKFLVSNKSTSCATCERCINQQFSKKIHHNFPGKRKFSLFEGFAEWLLLLDVFFFCEVICTVSNFFVSE